MHIVHVHIHVKPESVDAFKQATIDNASNSVKEPGNINFEVIQQADDPTRFVLVEIFKDAQASAAHKETMHYFRWRNTVVSMMDEPRLGIKYNRLFPAE
jgi:(4S)-4-hydroxy-5-phosphonooxypentane-2,3-dione isomerase